MKVCIIQPYYSMNGADNDSCFAEILKYLDQCDPSMDLIVLPEYSDIPSNIIEKEPFDESIRKYNSVILQKAKETAIRCNAMVFVNAAYEPELGFRNTTYAFDRVGNLAGKYFKAHPAPSEVRKGEDGGHGMDVAYSYETREPYVLEMEGIRFGFMTCYDFYFYDNFAQVARQNVDVIIGCSLQRSDSQEALEIINRFLCYNTNAYLVRASVSLGLDSKLCGSGCVIDPKGNVLVNMKSNIGMATAEIDPHDKYYKPAGFMGKMKSHYEYIEEGRRPWLYRNGGAAMVPFDDVMPYPRLCAHRGFSTVAPENTLPAFGAAIALGAKEIEFDVWETKDGELVSFHDMWTRRVTGVPGKIFDKTLDQLLTLDFGAYFDEKYRGLKIATVEDILKKFAGQTVMNVHIKTETDDTDVSESFVHKLVALFDRYDCRKHVYLMITNDKLTAMVKRLYPDIRICVGFDGNKDPMSMVERALRLGAQKVQFFKPYYDEEAIRKAHEAGILVNIFFADDLDEARQLLEWGADTILTNDYLKISALFES